jgi:hypothetical protein
MILIGTSTVIYLWLPFAAVIFAGIGNALFYIGGGTISLSLIPRKATAPGIFVAPGALGVLVGTLLGKSGNFSAWPLLLALIGLSTGFIDIGFRSGCGYSRMAVVSIFLSAKRQEDADVIGCYEQLLLPAWIAHI